MKKIILFILFITPFCFSQRESILDGEIENGGFGAVNVKFTNIKNTFGVIVGGYGGWLINHQLLIGAGGYGLVNNIKADQSIADLYNFFRQPYINFGYGGGVIEYYINPNKVVHSSVSLLIGAGGVNYRQVTPAIDNRLDYIWGDASHSSTSTVFVLEPGVSAEVNVASYCKVGFGVSYRYVSGVDLPELKNSDLSNVSAGISVKFGKF